MKNRPVSVECYSGYTYAQEPRVFVLDQQRRAICTIRKRWREPSGPCFEISTDNARIYKLVYHEATDLWMASSLRAYAKPPDIMIPKGTHMWEGDQR